MVSIHESKPLSIIVKDTKTMDVNSQINEAFERYYQYLYRYCLSRLDGDEQAAMDAVDSVFLIVKGKADSLDEIKDMKHWLITIAQNTIKNIRRKQKRYRSRFLLFDTGCFGAEDFVKSSHIMWWEKKVFSSWTTEEYRFNSRDMSDEEINELKGKFLKTLSDEDRELFCSHYEDGLSTRELAAKYGKSQDAIRMRLSRISMKLMERIKIYFQNERSF